MELQRNNYNRFWLKNVLTVVLQFFDSFIDDWENRNMAYFKVPTRSNNTGNKVSM